MSDTFITFLRVTADEAEAVDSTVAWLLDEGTIIEDPEGDDHDGWCRDGPDHIRAFTDDSKPRDGYNIGLKVDKVGVREQLRRLRMATVPAVRDTPVRGLDERARLRVDRHSRGTHRRVPVVWVHRPAGQFRARVVGVLHIRVVAIRKLLVAEQDIRTGTVAADRWPVTGSVRLL